MKLKDLICNIPYQTLQGSDEIEIDNISWDSRKVKPNSLFICIKNKNIDRHNYAYAAFLNGASAFIIEHEINNIPSNVTIIKVEDTKKAMAVISNHFYREPSKKLNLIGITGTNGKTSVSYYIASILKDLGHKVGIIGTIENSIDDKVLKTEKLNPTTPDSMELQASLSEMVERGANDVVMEVSSSALDNHRVYMCDFNIGVFTNLTQDHLDEHGTMENYKKAKMKLFKMCKCGIINTDDPIFGDIKREASCDIITYGIYNYADFTAENVYYSSSGVSFILNFRGIRKSVNIKIPGRFSVYNSLAAIAACYQLGIDIDEIIKSISKIKGVKGRFQAIQTSLGFTSVVDYAHSPDSLENVLNAVKEIKHNKIILIFGCGGNRDKTKRPIMGEIAGKNADCVILTSDNPRYENPMDIIKDIEAGIKATNCSYKIIEDRKTAIHAGLSLANPGDMVVIAGKGHEDYQIIGDKKIHFDDTEIINDWLEKHQYK